MTHTCQVCGDDCDEFGNRIESAPEVERSPSPITCIACRLEAIRIKKYGPKTIPKKWEGYVSLPYKD